jgi:photosystem II stability/assembly factor-like uncharacterized protein
MYMNNGYGNEPTIYKSTNGGVDWTALNPDPEHLVGMPFRSFRRSLSTRTTTCTWP